MIQKFYFKLRSILNHMSLWAQLAILMILTTSCIILILLYNNYTSVRNQSIQNQVELSSKLLQMESENMDQYLMLLANFSIQPYYDTDFTLIINQKNPISQEQLSYVRQQMHSYYYTRSDLLEYELYLINQDISVGRTGMQQRMLIQDSPAFDVENAVRKCAESRMHHYIEPADSPAFFTYYHSLFQVRGKKQQSIVRLKLNTSYLKQFLANHSGQHDILVFLNQDNELIYSNRGDIPSDSEQINEILSTVSHNRDGYDTVKIGHDNYLIVRAESAYDGLQLLCFTPLSYIDAQFDDIQASIILSGILIWLCSAAILYMLLRLLTTPLKTLAEKMRETGDGDFHTSLHASGNREVSELSNSFNSMVSRIDQLINRTYLAELSEKNARITALEAQINPHFLYNTLQAISTEALVNDQFQIHRMITALASNLRYTIKDSDLVSLRKEMQYVTNYIFLQKMRRTDTLHFSRDIEKGLEAFLVPKISLHTLVENSIIHGAGKNTGPITIHICARREEERLILRVRDNGCGIPKNRLDEVRKNLAGQKPSGAGNSIGLANLYIRLQLLYDSPAVMQIDSEEGSYTEVTLTLPAIKEDTHVQITDH